MNNKCKIVDTELLVNECLYGHDKNGNLFWLDRKKLCSPNAIVLSDSKTKTVSYCINEMEQVLLSTDDDVIAIDTEGYYFDFAKKYNGNYVTIGMEDKVFSNQLINYEDYSCHKDLISRMKEFISRIFDILNDGSLTAIQR
ncbi:hypothetical protein [Hungatella hathewayi]|uniref:hypothetical protein n=1 Tax=Hungatella hathewayi TaxID=154046 RepID=UPI003567F075